MRQQRSYNPSWHKAGCSWISEAPAELFHNMNKASEEKENREERHGQGTTKDPSTQQENYREDQNTRNSAGRMSSSGQALFPKAKARVDIAEWLRNSDAEIGSVDLSCCKEQH